MTGDGWEMGVTHNVGKGGRIGSVKYEVNVVLRLSKGLRE